jgi:hypothetical protein
LPAESDTSRGKGEGRPRLLFPVNELTMNLASQRVDHGYFEILIVAQAFLTEVLREDLAMRYRVGIRLELNSDSVSQWHAVFHIEEKFLHGITSGAPIRRCGIRSLTMTPGLLACESATIFRL